MVKHCSFNILRVIVNQHDLEMQQMDVKMTFFYTEETIYIEQPEGL